MATEDTSAELESKVTHLERHIEKQDAEIWRLSQRVEKLASLLKQQGDRLAALNERVSDGGTEEEPPPPHY